MGFQLVIAEGKEAGREFEFDQASVLIGRTNECDVILYETGVSRKHAQISEEEGSFFIEDLGSSNGTRVNGETISGRLALKSGDAISLGPVSFNFKPVEIEPTDTEPNAVEGGAHTRVVSIAELKKSRNKGVVGLSKDASRDEVSEMGRRGTQMLPTLKGPRPSADAPARRTSRPSGLKPQPSAPRGITRSSGSRPAAGGLSAADRARYMREGPLGRAKLWWAEASGAQRNLAMGVAAVLGLGLLGGMVAVLLPADAKPKPKEPTELSTETVPYSFGLGEGVMFEHADEKSFDFEVKSPVDMVVIVHFQAKDINSADEVTVSCNGVDVGTVPPDTLDSDEADLERLIPATLVHRGELNTITFDNTKNPPEQNTWRIWNLWLEMAVLPEGDADSLKIKAEEQLKRADTEWTQRDIGASNRWDAYHAYREAWLMLETIPENVRPATYALARDKMKESKRELDRTCRELLRKARSAFNLAHYDEARLTLDHVKDYFPTRGHYCPRRAEAEREDMEL